MASLLLTRGKGLTPLRPNGRGTVGVGGGGIAAMASLFIFVVTTAVGDDECVTIVDVPSRSLPGERPFALMDSPLWGGERSCLVEVWALFGSGIRRH